MLAISAGPNRMKSPQIRHGGVYNAIPSYFRGVDTVVRNVGGSSAQSGGFMAVVRRGAPELTKGFV